jgi:hypothetical protein
MSALDDEVIAVAARLVVEEGLEYGPAKRHAVKQLGLGMRTALPKNEDVERAVEEYIALFCADTQPGELRILRELALSWMERLTAFRPHIAGAVWHGSATAKSSIYLQLFCDDSKSAEIALIDMGAQFDTASATGFHGEMVDVLVMQPMARALGVYVAVHLFVYDFDDLRGALKPDARGRAPRGDTAALRKRLLGDQKNEDGR